MHLESIEVENFRNLKNGFYCQKGLNIIFGKNGQGKTNCLEAIYFLATTRSFRTTNLSELVSFNEDHLSVSGDVRLSESISHQLEIKFESQKKSLFVNGKKVKINEYLKNLGVFIFNTDALKTVRGMPEERRYFIDSGIISIYPAFSKTISDYQRCLKQKNTLLEEAQKKGIPYEKVAEMIEPWNKQLIILGARIYNVRLRYVKKLSEALENKILNNKTFLRDEKIKIKYVSSLKEEDNLADFESSFRERLLLRLETEIAAGHSLVGVHRDDLEITINDHDLRKFGSSGQQRSAFLALLLAKIEIYYQQNNEYPVLLVDDIDSELDYDRIKSLIEFLEGKTQTFVTTSKESFLEKFGQMGKLITIEQGEINNV